MMVMSMLGRSLFPLQKNGDGKRFSLVVGDSISVYLPFHVANDEGASPSGWRDGMAENAYDTACHPHEVEGHSLRQMPSPRIEREEEKGRERDAIRDREGGVAKGEIR